MTAEPAGSGEAWEELATQVSACTACVDLADSRRRVVVGQAPTGAELLLLTQAPGAAEESAARPLAGRSGHHLDFLLAEVGLWRKAIATVSVVKCRPPEGRAPLRAEIENCRGWTRRQIELIDPLLIVTMGQAAAEWALGRGVELSAVRGHLHQFGPWPLLPTFHPAVAIRVGRTGAPAMLLEQDVRYAAQLLPRLRTLRAAGGAPCCSADGHQR
ncbi:MAG TPA: uracil-DNA glycosylase [Sporichthyaceae bacterium]|nr:uracil-DNA glycosylase [Sporichthyaceae bacterium]